MYQIQVGDITINVIRKEIRNLHLAVYPPDGRVRIAAPNRMDEDAIKLFAATKVSWIKRQQKQFSAQVRLPELEYISGESHYFNGKRYLLNVLYESATPKVNLRHKHIDLFVRPGSDKTTRIRVLNAWYRRALRETAAGIISRYESLMQLKVAELGIKQMKTKWGTCNIEERRIWINLELAKKPINCLEYIIAHEMVHLLVRNHNDQFKAMMDNYLPQWRSFRDELNQLPVGYANWSY